MCLLKFLNMQGVLGQTLPIYLTDRLLKWLLPTLPKIQNSNNKRRTMLIDQPKLEIQGHQLEGEEVNHSYQTPQTSNSKLRVPVVFNPGNGYTKIAYEVDGVIKARGIRSGISIATDLDTDSFTLNQLNDAGRRRAGYDYNPWIMFPQGDRPSQIEYGKSIYALQLFIGAAWDLIEDGCTIDLHLLVHAPAELKVGLTQNLGREHDCTHKGKRKRFNIEIGKISKEGLGLASVDPSQDILIIDIGADTLIPTRWVNGKTSRELIGNALTQYGTSGLIRRLREESPSAIGANPTEENCIKAIEGNKLGDEADAVISNYWQDAIKAVKRNNLELLAGVDAIWLAGGLTRLKKFVAIAKADEAVSPKVVPNAQMADVIGFYQSLKNAGKLHA